MLAFEMRNNPAMMTQKIEMRVVKIMEIIIIFFVGCFLLLILFILAWYIFES